MQCSLNHLAHLACINQNLYKVKLKNCQYQTTVQSRSLWSVWSVRVIAIRPTPVVIGMVCSSILHEVRCQRCLLVWVFASLVSDHGYMSRRWLGASVIIRRFIQLSYGPVPGFLSLWGGVCGIGLGTDHHWFVSNLLYHEGIPVMYGHLRFHQPEICQLSNILEWGNCLHDRQKIRSRWKCHTHHSRTMGAWGVCKSSLCTHSCCLCQYQPLPDWWWRVGDTRLDKTQMLAQWNSAKT